MSAAGPEGPFLGIMMLKTAFPRPPGDVGNPDSWSFPVRFSVVQPATFESVVAKGRLDDGVVEAFQAAAMQLIEAGAAALTTSCGFLSPLRAKLLRGSDIPFIASSLEQIPKRQAELPVGRVGVMTIDGKRFTPSHLAAAGAPADTPFVGLESGRELHRVISGNLGALDGRAAEADVLEAGARLKRVVPDLGAVVLECTNLGPYAKALSHHLGLPVYDIVSFVTEEFGAAIREPQPQSSVT